MPDRDDMWTVTYDDTGAFEKFYLSLDEYKQAVFKAAVDHVLTPYGIDICQGEWGKNLGGGLYEFRVRRSLVTIINEYAPAGAELPDDAPTGGPVLLRAFCTFHGNRIVVLLAGYDKGRKPSKKQQDKMIAKARRALRRWKERG